MVSLEAEFDCYEWHKDSAWLRYLDNLYPTPRASRLLKFKRKFYRTHVNPDLPLEPPAAAAGPAPSATHSATPSAASSAAPGAAAGAAPRLQRIWAPMAAGQLGLAVVLTLASFLPLGRHAVLLQRLGRLLLGLGFIAAAVSENGLPKLRAEYWQLLMYNTHAQALLLLVSSLGLSSALALYSPLITAAGFISRQLHWQHDVLTRLTLNKPYLEIVVGAVGLLSWVTGQGSFLSVLLYWNAIRMLYTLCAPTKRAFGHINTTLRQLLARPSVPQRLGRAYAWASDRLYAMCEPAH